MTETHSASTTGEGAGVASAEGDTARAGSSGEVPASPERRRLPRVGELLGYLEEPAILISLSGLFFAMLWIHLEPVEVAGDAFAKWNFVRMWFYANDFSGEKWDHHMARMGVHIPTYIAQWVFGRGHTTYYVPQLVFAVAQAPLVYVIGKRIGGRIAGVLAALLLVYFDPMIRQGSQLLPEVFSATYALGALYLLLRATETQGKRRTAWLVASSVCFFFGYLAKETTVFFLPGLLLALWLDRKSFRDVVLYAGILLAGFVLESLAYLLFTHHPHRGDVIMGAHGQVPLPKVTFLQLFDRFIELDTPWLTAIHFFFAAFVGTLVLSAGNAARGTLAMVASYLFLLTFLVKGINPIQLWQRFLPRYFDPTAPFVQLVNGCFLVLAGRTLYRRWAGTRGAVLTARAARFGAVFVIALCSLLGFAEYVEARPKLEETHGLRVNTRHARVIEDTFVRNLPIIARERPKGIWGAFSVLLHDRHFTEPGEELHRPKTHKVRRNLWYAAKHPEVYTPKVLDRMIEKGCALRIHRRSRFLDVAPNDVLPARCDAELERLLKR
ncbi:MAG: glycosyltransferase family 39 protein [Pseudomonadota bacterium]|nr:MAG: hypothetical protein DIU78_01020 [Pseudomonadota bacterium]